MHTLTPTSRTPTPLTEDSAFDALLRDVAAVPELAAAPRSVEPGTRLSPSLTLVEQRAEGGMGALWEAWSSTLSRPVAVKLLTHRAGVYATHEAAALERLRHPRIVSMYGFGQTADGQAFIVMELLHGSTLSQRIRAEGPLDLDATRALVTQIADALSHAHAHGVLHRDIKPSNIVLRDTQDASIDSCLLDFGISRDLERGPLHRPRGNASSAATAPLRGAGTPGYMSPEQIAAPDDIDGRSDLWALAVVAHFALTGRRPDGDHFSREELPTSLRGWFVRALTPDPQRRFRTAREMATAFRDACQPDTHSPERDAAEAPEDPNLLTSFMAACTAASQRPAAKRAAVSFDRQPQQWRRLAVVAVLLLVWVTLAWLLRS